jgi:hypothetical protein
MLLVNRDQTPWKIRRFQVGVNGMTDRFGPVTRANNRYAFRTKDRRQTLKINHNQASFRFLRDSKRPMSQ